MLESWVDSDIETLATDNLNRIKNIKDPVGAIVFYHVAGYLMFEKFEKVLTKDSWYDLCDFIIDNWKNIIPEISATVNKLDLEVYDFKLVVRSPGEKYQPGVHVLPNIEDYIEMFKHTISTSGVEESWYEDEGAD